MQKWLKWLGLRPKQARPVGTDLESGQQEAEDTYRRDIIIKSVLFAILVFGALAAFPRGEVFEYTVQVGDTWRQATLVAPFNFPIYKDSDQVEREREQARRTTRPFFEEIDTAAQTSQAYRDTVQQQLNETLDVFVSSRYQRAIGNDEQAEADSLQYLQLRRNARVTLDSNQWEALTESAATHSSDLQEVIEATQETEVEGDQRGAAPQSERLDRRILQHVADVTHTLQRRHVIDIPLDSVYTDEIIVRNEAERIQRELSVDRLVGIQEAFERAEEQLRDAFPNNPEASRIAFAFFRDTFQAVYAYQHEETEQERNRRAQNVSSISGGVERGDVVVQQGERVTSGIKQQLTSLEREKNQRAATTIAWQQLSGEFILILVTFLFFFGALYFLRRDIWNDNGLLTLMTLLFGLVIAMYGVVIRVSWVEMYIVPVALVSVTLTIIFRTRTALFGTLVLALLGGQMLSMDLQYTMAVFIGAVCGIFSVRDIKNRGQFFLSAGMVFVGYALVLVGSWLFLGTPVSRMGSELLFAGIGASVTIVAQPLLWVIERVFGITTDLTLLELSDTNRPLLKELSVRAPGTFNHSMQVANLAEAAADQIGANALLVRVGALYHDIGKMLKPRYFVENPGGGENPHDSLKPRMSALVITSHVKEGIEMGKEYDLPEQVLQFVATHHGTARVEYFYNQAIKEADDPSAVLASDFRYPGPRPFSKETGILLLADSTEAASRSLDDPSYEPLRKLINRIFDNHIKNGQLDDTNLTFKELGVIKAQFLQMLSGVYHGRVKYPGQDEESTDEPWLTEVSFDPTKDVSVVWAEDGWHAGVTKIDSDMLEQLPGVRAPSEPDLEMVEASMHSGNGAPGAPPAPPMQMPTNVHLSDPRQRSTEETGSPRHPELPSPEQIAGIDAPDEPDEETPNDASKSSE